MSQFYPKFKFYFPWIKTILLYKRKRGKRIMLNQNIYFNYACSLSANGPRLTHLLFYLRNMNFMFSEPTCKNFPLFLRQCFQGLLCILSNFEFGDDFFHIKFCKNFYFASLDETDKNAVWLIRPAVIDQKNLP